MITQAQKKRKNFFIKFISNKKAVFFEHHPFINDLLFLFLS